METDSQLHENQLFTNEDYTETSLARHEFIHCTFRNCNFQKSDLSQADFLDCSFSGCNFSLAVMNNTGIKNAAFAHCKLVGIDFSRWNSFLFSASFERCHLDYSSFFQKKMKKVVFTDCSLPEVNFEEADLSGAVFKNCDLTGATFVRTILEKADFRTAINYTFDPEMNKIKGARFSYLGIAGLLGKYGIDVVFE